VRGRRVVTILRGVYWTFRYTLISQSLLWLCLVEEVIRSTVKGTERQGWFVVVIVICADELTGKSGACRVVKTHSEWWYRVVGK
jgi:hypothetical protein